MLELGNNQLTLGVELVVTGNNGAAVGEVLATNVGVAQVDADISEELVALIHEVEATLVLNQAVSGHENALVVEVVTHRTVAQSCDTVGTAIIVQRSVCGEGVHNTGLHNTVSIEQVGLTVDNVRSGGGHIVGLVAIVGRTVPVAHTGSNLHPNTRNQTAVLKVEGDTVQSGMLAVGAFKGARIEVVPTIIQLDPAVSQLAVDSVVCGTVHVEQAALGDRVAAIADQMIVHNRIGVAGCGNHAPVDDRVADGAVGTTGVAGLGAGGSQIGNSLGGMLMPANLGCSVLIEPSLRAGNFTSGVVGEENLGIDQKILHTEGIHGLVNEGHDTLLQSQLDALLPDTTVVDQPSGVHMLVALVGGRSGDPSTNGEGSEDIVIGSGNVAGALNDDGGDVVIGLNGVGSGEAVGHSQALQLPRAAVVEIEYHLNLVNGSDVSGDNVHPVERTDQDAGSIGIVGLHLDGSTDVSRNNDAAGGPGLVAGIVCDHELNGVVAVGQGKTGHGDLTVCVGALNLHAVNVSLCGGCVQAGHVEAVGVILNRDLKGSVAVVDGLACHSGELLTLGIHDHGSLEDRDLAVIDGGGIVQRNIVDVEGVLAVQVGLGDIVIIITGGGACTVINRNVDIVEQVVLSLSSDIVPALIQVVKLAVVKAACANTQLSVTGIVGHVQPEADGHGVEAVNDGELEVQSLIAGLEDLGEIALDCQSVITVSDLSGGTVDNRNVTALVLTVVPVFSVVIRDLAVGARRTVITVVGVDGPTGQILILEIVNDLGALTQAHVGSCGDLAHSSGQQGLSRGGALLGGGEIKAADGTDTGSGQGEGHVGSLQNHVLMIVGSGETEINRIAVRNDHVRLGEDNGVGHNDVHSVLTDDLAVNDHLSGDVAQLTVGHEQTVSDGTEGRVGQLPDSVLGDVCGGTDQVSTNSGELDRAAGGEVILLGSDVSLLKFTGCGRGGNDQDTVSGLTLCAVGGTAVDIQLLTGTLGQESGGSAAVTVHGVHATQRQHELCHLVVVEACGVGRLTTVVHDHNEGTVGLDTHKGTGRGIAGVVLGVLVLTVLDQEAKVSGNNLLLPAGDGVLGGADQHLGHIGGTGNTVLLVKVDDETGLSA